MPFPFEANIKIAFATTDDFNLDGRPDLAVLASRDFLTTFFGKLYFSLGVGVQPVFEFESGGSGIATGDLNRDAISDVVTTNAGTGEIVVSLVGRSSVAAPARYSVGTQARSPVVDDFNRDGRLDVACVTTEGVALLNGRGNGTLSAASTIPLQGLGPMAAGDVNRDGKVDLVSLADGRLYVLLGRGDGSFDAAQSFTSVAQGNRLPPTLVLADLEPDGDLDAVFPGVKSIVVELNQAR